LFDPGDAHADFQPGRIMTENFVNPK